MKVATVIPLEFWQDPVEDVILIYSEQRCSVYCACWNAASEPADFIGHLAFKDASDVHSSWREHPPYSIPKDHRERSFILEIPDSDFVREFVTRHNLRTPEVPLRFSDRHHFVVMGHDIFHEIVASGFTASTIPNNEVKDSTLRTLLIRGTLDE